MKPSECAALLPVCLAANRPVWIWGKPGISKTALATQAALTYSPNVIDFRASTKDPTDISGIPSAGPDGRTVWLLPEFLPTDPDWRGTFIFDEMNTGTQATMNSLLGFVHERRIGSYFLPAGARFIACGNGEKDGCHVQRISKAMGSRFIHIDLEPDLNDWTLYAAKAGFHIEVIAFNRFCPEGHHAFDPRSDDHTFPCARTYEYLSDIVKANPPPSLELELYQGCIGKVWGAKFAAFRKVFRNAPNLDAIILNPDTAPVPSDLGIMHATAAGLAWKATPGNFPAIARYVNRLDPEFGMYLVTGAQRRDAQIANTPAFIDWAARNASYLT